MCLQPSHQLRRPGGLQYHHGSCQASSGQHSECPLHRRGQRVNPWPHLHHRYSTAVWVRVKIAHFAQTILLVSFPPHRKLRRRDNTKFRLQLCTAMILMLIFFVIGIYQVETFEICVVASALLHYFTLVSAMWMASDALLMILKLTLVVSRHSTCFTVVISLLCWRKCAHSVLRNRH